MYFEIGIGAEPCTSSEHWHWVGSLVRLNLDTAWGYEKLWEKMIGQKKVDKTAEGGP